MQGELGKVYRDGEIIIREGERGDCMFVIQSGEVEVIQKSGERETLLGVRKQGEFLGEMAIFENEVRSATVRARGEVRVITVDKKTFLRRIHEDPSIAYKLVQNLCSRVRQLSDALAKLTPGTR